MLSSLKNDVQDQTNQKESIKKELRTVEKNLSDNENCFNMLDDQHLIDATIYQRKTLLEQYHYLLQKAKAMEKRGI